MSCPKINGKLVNQRGGFWSNSIKIARVFVFYVVRGVLPKPNICVMNAFRNCLNSSFSFIRRIIVIFSTRSYGYVFQKCFDPTKNTL